MEDPAGRWASAHSLPHTLRIEGDRVVSEPHENVARARTGEPRVLRDEQAIIDAHSDLALTLDGAGSRATITLDEDVLRAVVASGGLSATTSAGS